MMNDLEEYLKSVLEGFNSDPADSLYQEGYEAAIHDVIDRLQDLQNAS